MAPLPRLIFVVIMVAAMLTKASPIAGYFMHLKQEHPFLLAVPFATFGTVASFAVRGKKKLDAEPER